MTEAQTTLALEIFKDISLVGIGALASLGTVWLNNRFIINNRKEEKLEQDIEDFAECVNNYYVNYSKLLSTATTETDVNYNLKVNSLTGDLLKIQKYAVITFRNFAPNHYELLKQLNNTSHILLEIRKQKKELGHVSVYDVSELREEIDKLLEKNKEYTQATSEEIQTIIDKIGKLQNG